MVQGDREVVQGDIEVVQGDREVVQGDREVVQGDREVVQGDRVQGDFISLVQIPAVDFNFKMFRSHQLHQKEKEKKMLPIAGTPAFCFHQKIGK